MGAGESRPHSPRLYTKGLEALQIRFQNENKKISNEIETAKTQLSERIEDIGEQLSDVEEYAASEKIKDLRRQFQDLNEKYIKDVRTVEDDKNATFYKLRRKMEELEEQGQTDMNWEDLDDLTFRMIMFYSQYDDELDNLEKSLKPEVASLESTLSQLGQHERSQLHKEEDTAASFLVEETAFLHGHGLGSSLVSGPMRLPEPFVPDPLPSHVQEPMKARRAQTEKVRTKVHTETQVREEQRLAPEYQSQRNQDRVRACAETTAYEPKELFTLRGAVQMEGTSSENLLTVNESGRSFDLSKVGFYLDIPRGAVRQNTEIWHSVRENFVPSPLKEFESFVSYVVELGPSHVLLQKPITITLMHSGVKNIDVKVYDKDRRQWITVEDFNHSSVVRHQCTVRTVILPLTKLTAVAVTSRVLKYIDTFQVSPSGCVVRSSTCRDVSIRFPEGAVSKTMRGCMKVIPMPKVFPVETEEFPCPFLSINGFEEITFSNYVIVEMPHPCPSKYPIGKVNLMCLKNNEWSEISSDVLCIENRTTIELHVRHFSGLWPWLPIVPISFLILYDCIRQAEQNVCFAAFKENSQPSLSPKVTLMCVANNEQDKMDEMRGRGYTRLACETVTKGMQPNSRAYVQLKGSFDAKKELYLQFVKGEICRKELQIEKKRLDVQQNAEILTLTFYQEKAKKTLLCELHCHEDLTNESTSLLRALSIEDPDSDAVYKMKGNPRGLMIIINMEKFEDKLLPERTGSVKDVKQMEELFAGYLDFTVRTLRNKGRFELLKELREISENPKHGKYECLAVCIMSHGEDDLFYAADGHSIDVKKQVVSMFTNTKCEIFRYKPKLFFIQACRGPKGNGVPNNEVLVDGYNPPNSDSDMSDILTAYSSYEGYAAFRNVIEGSFFIQSLVKVLRQYAENEHLAEMLTRVNREVHNMAHQIPGRTQVPMPSFTLRKKLYFWPGKTFE